MLKKPFVMILLVAALILSTTAVSASPPPQQIDLKAQARSLLAQKFAVPVDSLRQVGRAPLVRYPMQGLVIQEFKFIDAQGGSYGIALNAGGQEVDVARLDAVEKAAYEAKYGKLDPQLRKALALARPEDRVEVDIWLKVPESTHEGRLVKPEVNGNDEASGPTLDAAAVESMEAAADAAEMSRVAAVNAPITSELEAQGLRPAASELAPLINVTMPVKTIRQYAQRPEVDTIYLAAQPGNELNIARQVVGASVVNSYGITGSGSKVAIVEYNGMVSATNPYLSGITRDNLYGCAVNTHASGIAGIIRSRHATYRGIAPATDLWVGCGKTDAQLQAMTNHANGWGAETYNISWYSGSNHTPGALDKFYDNMLYAYADLVVKSAGNRGTIDGWVTPPGLGFNTLTVGNFDDNNTVGITDDVMNPTSSWQDPISLHNDREKPEVVAPGTDIVSTTAASPWVGGVGSGTSFSAPMVAGMTSLLYERNSLLKVWPEGTKAIIMATAVRNKEGDARLSDKDGAGGVWAVQADWIARNDTSYGRWGGVEYTCSTGSDWNVATIILAKGQRARAVIVWDQNTTYASYASKPSADLDLQIWRTSEPLTKQPIAASYTWDNNYEIVDFKADYTGTYVVQVDKFRCDLSPDYMSWAWWAQP